MSDSGRAPVVHFRSVSLNPLADIALNDEYSVTVLLTFIESNSVGEDKSTNAVNQCDPFEFSLPTLD